MRGGGGGGGGIPFFPRVKVSIDASNRGNRDREAEVSSGPNA